MEFADGKRDVVDPEVRAYVSSLVTALGGSGADEDGRYILGDDALAVLRDIKRWLKLYDEKANRLDVARVLAETNLVNGDLLQILASWPEHEAENRFKAKVALSCLELLVPLTWPMERLVPEMTVNHHRHTPYLQQAQIGYKRSIINFDGSRILFTAVRVALPSISEAQKERSTRDVGIIKLVLYFLRNIVMIAPPPNTEYDGDEAEISRSATIDAFDYQDIFHLLLTLCSTMGEDFSLQDVVVMEVIFHLVKGVSIDKLFMNEVQLDHSKVDELVGLRNKEAGMQRGYQRTQPTRHNRFGTMIWVQREDHKMSSVSGQDALLGGGRTLAKMDKSKKFKPPRRVAKTENGPLDFNSPVALSARANKNLRAFVEDFLDSGFNPLFQHVRKALDREADRVLDYHSRQFFYLVSWFLEAERVRRKFKNSAKKPKKGALPEEADSFAIVAGVLNQEMFITLNRAMENSYENKSWQDLNAEMRCFNQILLTVQEMSESPLEEDQEIAENILSRIFYEETTHDRVANIIRYYKDQGFGYLDSCTELAHNYLRILENYSKQNSDLMVRSKRRMRRKKQAAKAAEEGAADADEVDESDAEDEARAERTSSERKFDFKRFSARFLSQGCVDTFVTFCGFYNDLKPEQLKRAHRFFYRAAFKMEMSVMLFRVDIIALFHRMIKGPEGLDPLCSMFKEWDELIKQLIKRCIRKIQQRPEIIIEMLFSKTNGTAHFLEYGYEKQTISSKPRPAAQLEVKPGMEWEEQVGIVASVLLDRNQGDHIDWVKAQLSFAEVERRTWEKVNTSLPSTERDTPTEEGAERAVPESTQPPAIFVKPDNEERRMAMFKNGHLRLLMTLVGFERLMSSDEDDPNSPWIIPSLLSADQLTQSLNLIKAKEFNPPVFEDGILAEDYIRRKSSARPLKRREAFDDEDENAHTDDDEELFPAGGPTARKDALAALKKTRHRRRRSRTDDAGDEAAEEKRKEREAQRLAREREKRMKIKSALYVGDSDDEDDEERDQAFFAKEELLRQNQARAVKELLNIGKQPSKKRTAVVLDEDSDDEVLSGAAAGDRSSSETAKDDALDDSEENNNSEEETPPSTPHVKSSQTKRRRISDDNESNNSEEAESPNVNSPIKNVGMVDMAGLNDDDEEDDVPVLRTARRRPVSGFIMDSSDEE